MAAKKKSPKKSEQAETTLAQAVEAPKAPAEPTRGERGEVGVATAGLTIRQQWKAAGPGAGSLKRFAREQLKAGNAVAKEWFANKKGAKNEKRTDKNQARINLEKQASKAARRKKSQGKQAKPDAAAPAAK